MQTMTQTLQGRASGQRQTAADRYARALHRAASLIRARGAAMVVVQQMPEGPYDPVLDGRPTRETRTHVMGLRVQPRGMDAADGAFATETARVLLAGDALPMPPRPKDRLVAGGGVWAITATASVTPGESPILHLLDLRRTGDAPEEMADGDDWLDLGRCPKPRQGGDPPAPRDRGGDGTGGDL